MTQPATRPDDSRDRLRLWLKLLKTTRRIEGALRENLRTEFDTTLPRFDVMAALARHPQGLKMSDLSGVLRVSNGNVTGIVDRLSDEGFLLRVPVPGDRRATLVRLTERGQQEFARQAQAHAGWIDGLLAGFDDTAVQDLITRLDRIEKGTKA